MKQPLRYFSIGLFSAAIVLSIGLYFSDTEKVEELAAEELIPYVEQEGFHVLSNEEYITLSFNSDNSEKEQPKESEKETASDSNDSKEKASKEDKKNEKPDSQKEESKKEDKNKKDEVVTYTLKIEAGMVPSSISAQLEENNIIEDAFEFDQYLEKNDYSKYVQLGEFKVSSDMNFKEIAEEITN